MKNHSIFFLLVLNMSSLVVEAHPGIGIVQNRSGIIYYTDLTHVWKISKDGKKEIAVRNVHTHQLVLDASDNLIGEHLWYNGDQRKTWGYYVWRLSPDGKLDKVITDKEGFMEDYSLVQDHFGHLYKADRSGPCQHVMRFKNGQLPVALAPDCFDNIRWMQSTKDGHVYVVDFQDIHKVDAQGKVTTIAKAVANPRWKKSTVDNQNSVMGVWDDVSGNIYAAVASSRQVKKFSPDGKVTVMAQLKFPWSVSGGLVDQDGYLWLLEFNTVNQVRIEKVGKDGRRRVM